MAVRYSRLPALLLLPVLLMWTPALGAPGGEAPSTPDGSCDVPSGNWQVLPHMEPSDVEATLVELHTTYSALPGFIDVYYHAGKSPAFRPLFEDAVPAAARVASVDVPVGFDVVEGLVAQEGGDTPDQDDLLCKGVRPGARLTTPVGICTLAFLFTDGANVYASTAGHCISVGQVAVGAVGVALSTTRIGEAVFSTGNAGPGNDFALIRIDDNKLHLVDAEMCDFAGPTGFFTGTSILGSGIVVTGHGGGVVDAPARPKQGVGVTWGANSFNYVGNTISGDSGAPVRLVGGEVLGTHTHGVAAPTGLKIGTRWDRGLDLAAAEGFTGLQLMNVSYVHLI